jgi:hypothetical protein
MDRDNTIITVVEMSQSSWLVGGVLPGIERQPFSCSGIACGRIMISIRLVDTWITTRLAEAPT